MPYQIYQTFLDIYNIKRQANTPINTPIKTPMNTNIKTPMNTPYWEFFTAWM